MVRLRVRIRFAKQGDLRLIGHRDLMRCFERIFRRAGLTMQFSQGFHPKPRMTFLAALAVGIEGLDEVMELELSEPIEAPELLRRLAPHAPPGLEFRSAEVLPEGTRKARVRSVRYEVPFVSPPSGVSERIERLMSSSSWPIIRPKRTASIDLRRQILELALKADRLTIRLETPRHGGSAGPRDVLAALGLDNLQPQGAPLRRTEVEVCR